MNKITKAVIASTITAIVLGTIGAVVYLNRLSTKPFDWDTIDDKIKSIIIPKAPIGELTESRDLRGTWISSLSKKGFQLYGKFDLPGSVTNVHQNGDIELIIDKVENNIASGQMRFTNVCGSSQTIAPPPVGKITVPEKCIADSGYSPVSIRVSSTALDFGTFASGGIVATMQGTFTTDMIAGTMGIETEYGIIKGVFNLMRQR